MARSSETFKHTLRYLDYILVNDSRHVFTALLWAMNLKAKSTVQEQQANNEEKNPLFNENMQMTTIE